jgi:hypothetical protein
LWKDNGYPFKVGWTYWHSLYGSLYQGLSKPQHLILPISSGRSCCLLLALGWFLVMGFSFRSSPYLLLAGCIDNHEGLVWERYLFKCEKIEKSQENVAFWYKLVKSAFCPWLKKQQIITYFYKADHTWPYLSENPGIKPEYK